MRNPSFTGTRNKDIPKASIIKFFTVGGLLLVVPLVAVIDWPTTGCDISAVNFCTGSHAYRMMTTFLPYVMVIGGVLIGYNMKRISDSLRVNQSVNTEET